MIIILIIIYCRPTYILLLNNDYLKRDHLMCIIFYRNTMNVVFFGINTSMQMKIWFNNVSITNVFEH